MPHSLRASFVLLSLTAMVLGQGARASVRELIEKENCIIALQWHRDATGNFEHAVAGARDAPFAALSAPSRRG